MTQNDKVISNFLHSLGPWNQSVVIGGGYALIIYKLYLSNTSAPNPVGTKDIDSLISRKSPQISPKNIDRHLKSAGFHTQYKTLDTPPTQSYTKEISGEEIEIEFLTDNLTRENKDQNVSISGVTAQPLSYLQLSLQNSIPFKTHSNQSGLVVSPGAWVFHKGLTFPKRKHLSKKLKDLYGIWYTATQLGSFSSLAIAELQSHMQDNASWAKTFKKNLSSWTENASPNDYINLESQDPSGHLSKRSFTKLIESLS